MSAITAARDELHAGWEIVDSRHRPPVWPTSAETAAVQGPLALHDVRADVIELQVGATQTALLVEGKKLRAYFFPGRHLLPLEGRMGRLFLLDASVPLTVPWSRDIPLPPRDSWSPRSCSASGSLEVRIASPLRFCAAVLGIDGDDVAETCRRLLSPVMPTLLAVRLAMAGRGGAPVDVRACVTSTTPAEIDPDLSRFGLTCDALVLDPSFLAELPGSRSRSRPDGRRRLASAAWSVLRWPACVGLRANTLSERTQGCRPPSLPASRRS